MWHAGCGILVPQPGIEPAPPAVGAQSPNPWTAREVPPYNAYFHTIIFTHEHGVSFHLFLSVQFRLSVSSSFHCAGPSRPWLNLLLVIFLDAIVSGIFLKFFF